MKYLDIKPRKSIHELNIGELFAHYSDEFKEKNGIVIGIKIPVKSISSCWFCRKEMMAMPFEWYCSMKCSDASSWAQDMWRNE